MNTEKTTLTNFTNYVHNNKLASTRLMNSLKSMGNYLYNYETEVRVEDIRNITDKLFLRQRNIGKKSFLEFKNLRNEYLQYLSIMENDETDDNAPPFHEREKYSFWIRPDILQTLATIKNETSFIENALLEKFERDQIPFTAGAEL